jgi:hypothetical protein
MKEPPRGCSWVSIRRKDWLVLDETHHALADGFLDLVNLGIAEASNLDECLGGGRVDRLSWSVSNVFSTFTKLLVYRNSVEGVGLQRLDLFRTHT